MSNNRTVHDLCAEIVPSRNIDDLILPCVVVETCRELIEEHHRAELVRSYGLRPRNRVLLAGAPGNGKTSLAEGIAHGLMAPFIVARYDVLIQRSRESLSLDLTRRRR
jgi:AAA+ superfamily predicted ATPase